MAIDKPMKKYLLISAGITFWLLFFYFDSGLGMTLLLFVPTAWFIAMCFAFAMSLIEDFLGWLNKK